MAVAERGGYGRERTKLTQAHVKRAKGLIASDGLEGRGFDFVDTACQGLVLRVTRRSGTWLLKRRTGTVTLGDMDSLPVASARVAAEEVRSAERRGLTKRVIAQELDVFSRVTARGIGTEQALDIAFTKPTRTIRRRCPTRSGDGTGRGSGATSSTCSWRRSSRR